MNIKSQLIIDMGLMDFFAMKMFHRFLKILRGITQFLVLKCLNS